MSENFLKRWARNKTEAAKQHAAPDDAAEGMHNAKPDALPSMDDVRLLKPDGDFSRFIARNVDPDVRRTALKKLFSDPHFHRIDGLDIYMGDYTQPSPLPPEMLAGLLHAKSTLFPRPLYEVEQETTVDPGDVSNAGAMRDEELDAAADIPDLPPDASDRQEVDIAPGQDTDADQACVPFNEHVNFSHERGQHWPDSRKQ